MKPSIHSWTSHARRFAAGLAFGLGLAHGAAPAAAPEPLRQQQVEAALPQIEDYIQKTMKLWKVPGIAVGIVAEDKLVFTKGYGVREVGASAPVDPDTVFQIGSTTKAFLGLTEAMMVDQGKMSWTDKVVQHYPEFQLADPWATREFEIADLLAQRSGLPAFTLTNMMLYDYPRTDVIKALRYVQPETSFRSAFAYQNAFHLVAGHIVARLAGVDTWEAFLQAGLLDPLGMSSSSYDARAIEQSANRASGHKIIGQEVSVDSWAPFPYNAGGAGNLNSNVRDLSRWLRLQINQGEIDGKRLVSAEAIAETHQPRIATAGPLAEVVKQGAHDQISYATGWLIHSTPQGRVIEHGGGTVGYTSHLAFDPDRRFGIVILTNLAADVGIGSAMPLGKYITDVLQGRPAIDYSTLMLASLREKQAREAASLRPPADARPPRPLDDYAGAYTSPTLGRVVVAVENGKLAFKLGPRSLSATLEPWSGDVFVTHMKLPAFGPNPYTERRKLFFLTDGHDKIVGFDWKDDIDGSGHPPFTRDEPVATNQ